MCHGTLPTATTIAILKCTTVAILKCSSRRISSSTAVHPICTEHVCCTAAAATYVIPANHIMRRPLTHLNQNYLDQSSCAVQVISSPTLQYGHGHSMAIQLQRLITLATKQAAAPADNQLPAPTKKVPAQPGPAMPQCCNNLALDCSC